MATKLPVNEPEDELEEEENDEQLLDEEVDSDDENETAEPDFKDVAPIDFGDEDDEDDEFN